MAKILDNSIELISLYIIVSFFYDSIFVSSIPISYLKYANNLNNYNYLIIFTASIAVNIFSRMNIESLRQHLTAVGICSTDFT